MRRWLLCCTTKQSEEGEKCQSSNKADTLRQSRSCCRCINLGRRRTSSEREMLRDAYTRLIASPERAKLIDELARFGETQTLSPRRRRSCDGEVNKTAAGDYDREESTWKWDDITGSTSASTVSARDEFGRVGCGAPPHGSDSSPLSTGLVHTMMALGALDMVGAMCARKTDEMPDTNNWRRGTLHDDDSRGGYHIKTAHFGRGKSTALNAKTALKVGAISSATMKLGAAARSKSSGSSATQASRFGPPGARPRAGGALGAGRAMRRSGR